MNKKIIIHAWLVEKKNDIYYLPFSHWIYLKEIVKYYDEVVLLSPCVHLESADETPSIDISMLGNITVYELPVSSGGYIGSLKYFSYYLKAYSAIKGITTYYARYPTPFGWLQKIYGKRAQRIIHYVGDPIDAAKNNPNFSGFKKRILISGFFIENSLYDWACKGAQVFTNGHHLAEKLKRKNISAAALISTTLTDNDFNYTNKSINPNFAKFIYLGYLRTAKGVEVIIRAFELYNNKYPNSSLTIIGAGEVESKLKEMVLVKKIKNINFLGKVEDRAIINKELRAADIFLFASLSEGSPRVILEAMANGLAVISTPVGSLPDVFKSNEDIIFSEFNDSDSFLNNMISLANDEDVYNSIRATSYNKVKGFTIDRFIKEIFHD